MEKYIGTYHKSSPFIQNLLKTQICTLKSCGRITPPSMQISSNLPVDSYLHVLAEIPPSPWKFSPFCHSLQIYWNLHAEIPTPPHTCPCFVTVWEIYSAILLLCSCLYFTQWRTTMNYPTWRHHVNS